MSAPQSRDEDAARRFADQFGNILAESGWPRMSARVFAAIMASRDGRLTAAELSEQLQASPAAISGAVRYLLQLHLATRERDPGSRRDVYTVQDDAWMESMLQQDKADRAVAGQPAPGCRRDRAGHARQPPHQDHLGVHRIPAEGGRRPDRALAQTQGRARPPTLSWSETAPAGGREQGRFRTFPARDGAVRWSAEGVVRHGVEDLLEQRAGLGRCLRLRQRHGLAVDRTLHRVDRRFRGQRAGAADLVLGGQFAAEDEAVADRLDTGRRAADVLTVLALVVDARRTGCTSTWPCACAANPRTPSPGRTRSGSSASAATPARSSLRSCGAYGQNAHIGTPFM